MGITLPGVLFVVALFSLLAVMAHFTRKKAIDEPIRDARAQGSAVAEFVDDLQRYRWITIIGVAALVALDKSFHFSSGLLQSRLAIGILITAVFVARLLLRRNRRTHAD